MEETLRSPKLERYRSPEVAGEYDRRWAGSAGRRRNERKWAALERALERLAEGAGAPVKEVLDVPCGTGRFVRELTGRGLRYLGGELSGAMLAEARAKCPGARFVTCDLRALPLPDRAVDAVVCIRFLHLVREPGQRVAFLKEMARVARLGVIADYRHSRTLRVAGRRLRHRLGLLPRAPANPAPASVRAEIAAAGLVEAGWLPVHHAPWLSDKVLVVARRNDR